MRWVLGAYDAEMRKIKTLLHAWGQPSVDATYQGRRVSPRTAYQADPVPGPVVWVECSPETGIPSGDLRVDHHLPGDPGYGAPPARAFEASSMGQTVALLKRLGVLPQAWEPPRDLVITGVRDHALGAALAGAVPGVRPSEVLDQHAAERAEWLSALPSHKPECRAVLAFGAITPENVKRAIARTQDQLRLAPRILFAAGPVLDLREIGTLPELPTALGLSGVAALYRMPTPEGMKVGIIGGGLGTAPGPEVVIEFMQVWAPRMGLKGIYGDAARGFAGGYE